MAILQHNQNPTLLDHIFNAAVLGSASILAFTLVGESFIPAFMNSSIMNFSLSVFGFFALCNLGTNVALVPDDVENKIGTYLKIIAGHTAFLGASTAIGALTLA